MLNCIVTGAIAAGATTMGYHRAIPPPNITQGDAVSKGAE